MCEKNGVSMEGEFVFSRAVGEFLREEVREGTFKGNYVLNLKEQLRMRCMREWRRQKAESFAGGSKSDGEDRE